MEENIVIADNSKFEVIPLPITFEDIEKATADLKKTPIKGKEYVEVNQRIKAYRKLHPETPIITDIIEFNSEFCLIKATIYDNNGNIISTGHAMEEKNSSFINKTSYVENCETSAIGRALGIAGYGIDTAIASAEEVENAIEGQMSTITLDSAKELVFDRGKHKGKTYQQVLEEDEDYLKWMLGNTKNETTKQALTLLLGEEQLTEEEEKEKLKLLTELNDLVNNSEQVEFDDIITFYKIQNPKINKTSDLTIFQLKEAIKKMKK